MVRYYTGSNWFLEDNEYSSQSYMYLQQIVIPGYDDSVITFHVKKMPHDWVGSDLLEVNQLPYRFIKSDNYGTLEQVGIWMRFISRNEIENPEMEYLKINKWASLPTKSENTKVHNNQSYSNINKQAYTQHDRNSMIKPYVKKNENRVPNLTDPLRPETIHQNFQQFLNKFNIHTITNNRINGFIPVTGSISIVPSYSHK